MADIGIQAEAVDEVVKVGLPLEAPGAVVEASGEVVEGLGEAVEGPGETVEGASSWRTQKRHWRWPEKTVTGVMGARGEVERGLWCRGGFASAGPWGRNSGFNTT